MSLAASSDCARASFSRCAKGFSSHCVRARRTRPTGDLLSFAGSNKSRQSKEPERQPYGLWPTARRNAAGEQCGALNRRASKTKSQGNTRRSARALHLLLQRPRSAPAPTVPSALGSSCPSGVGFSSWTLCDSECPALHQPHSFVPKATGQMAGVESLCFAYFHLGPRMKVGRPSGESDAPSRSEKKKPSRSERPAALTQ